ncbi:hypothetical protein M0811_03090 [Anaeramoeba ignava]|uniref:Uncharacterized protein n=1 Tax=Anaeramoeba ignava TaxID=1746090 RepID=A0A9Q0R579_ANAIG|nr:hypothetical protein M0811_03090 [Anaeramoeba ignava]
MDYNFSFQKTIITDLSQYQLGSSSGCVIMATEASLLLIEKGIEITEQELEQILVNGMFKYENLQNIFGTESTHFGFSEVKNLAFEGEFKPLEETMKTQVLLLDYQANWVTQFVSVVKKNKFQRLQLLHLGMNGAGFLFFHSLKDLQNYLKIRFPPISGISQFDTFQSVINQVEVNSFGVFKKSENQILLENQLSNLLSNLDFSQKEKKEEKEEKDGKDSNQIDFGSLMDLLNQSLENQNQNKNKN